MPCSCKQAAVTLPTPKNYNIRDKFCLASRGTSVESGARVNQPLISDVGLGTSLRRKAPDC
jgi:hypothetical protein